MTYLGKIVNHIVMREDIYTCEDGNNYIKFKFESLHSYIKEHKFLKNKVKFLEILSNEDTIHIGKFSRIGYIYSTDNQIEPPPKTFAILFLTS